MNSLVFITTATPFPPQVFRFAKAIHNLHLHTDSINLPSIVAVILESFFHLFLAVIRNNIGTQHQVTAIAAKPLCEVTNSYKFGSLHQVTP